MEKTTMKTKPGMNRAEYIEAEPNVRLHITDAGEGRPVVLIHGWPLSDEMYEYQYNVLMKSGHSMFLEEMDKFNSELIKFAGK